MKSSSDKSLCVRKMCKKVLRCKCVSQKIHSQSNWTATVLKNAMDSSEYFWRCEEFLQNFVLSRMCKNRFAKVGSHRKKSFAFGAFHRNYSTCR